MVFVVMSFSVHSVVWAGAALVRTRGDPESAGADLGPICYGKGDRVTVTDANLYLGKLDTAYPLGGSLRLQDHQLHSAFSALAGRASS